MPICEGLNRRASSHPAWRRRIDERVVLGLLSVLILAASPTYAQITNATDDDPPIEGSLRFEVDRSMGGDVIPVRIDQADGMAGIDLRTTITFDNDVTLDNTNPIFNLVDIESPEENALFEIEDNIDVVLRDMGILDNRTNRDDDINLQGAGSTITFDLTRTEQFVASDIIGSGSVIKDGELALELFGVNTFLGGLTILNGDVVGDVLSLGTPRIDLAPDAATKSVRLVFENSGLQTIDGLGPIITDGSTNGGSVLFVKRGSGLLNIADATIASTIGIEVERGTLIAGERNFANGNDFEIGVGATLDLQSPLDGLPIVVSSAGKISGEGTFTTDAGFLTLTGDLSEFTGTFDVKAPLISLPPEGLPDEEEFFSGFVVIDPDVNPGTLNFDLTIGSSLLLPEALSTVVFNDDDGFVFTGDISGPGRFVKLGSGTTELTGIATHTGGTEVIGGTLRGNLANLRGDILMSSGTGLEIAQSSSGTFNGIITSVSGTSTVSKLGAGVVTFVDTQPFAGLLDAVEGGIYFSAGTSLPNAGLTIGSGGAGSRVSLGADFNPLGGAENTIAIGGALTINSDARVTVGIGGQSNLNTRYAATGPVVIQPGAVLVVQPSVGVFTPGLTYDVVTGSSVTGDFDIEQSLYFFDIFGASVGNAYRLTLAANGESLVTAATTPNQFITGTVLDEFRVAPDGGDLRIIAYQASIASATVAQVPTILDSSSPDSIASANHIELAAASRTWRGISNRLALQRVKGIGHHDRREERIERARDNAAERMRKRRGSKRLQPDAAQPKRERMGPSLGERNVGPWVAWFQGSGLLGELDSSDAKGFDYITAGPIIGADRALSDEVRIGFALAGKYNRYDSSKGSDKGEGGTVETTVYGAWLGEPVEVILGARYAHAWVESDRLIEVGFTSDRADGDLEGNIFGAYAELTRGFELPGAAEIAPMASVAYTHLMWGDFDEGGVSPLRMEIEEEKIDSIVTSLGFRVAAETEMDEGLIFRPRFKALWNHEWGDTEREVTGGFASNPTTGVSAFSVEGAEVPSDFAELSVGWDVGYATHANLFLEWEGRFAADLIENSVSVGARVAW